MLSTCYSFRSDFFLQFFLRGLYQIWRPIFVRHFPYMAQDIVGHVFGRYPFSTFRLLPVLLLLLLIYDRITINSLCRRGTLFPRQTFCLLLWALELSQDYCVHSINRAFFAAPREKFFTFYGTCDYVADNWILLG